MPADKCPTCGSPSREIRGSITTDVGFGGGHSMSCHNPWHATPTPPAPADAAPKRVVYAVRPDDRTGRYAAAITRDGVDILHLHVGSVVNTTENVMLAVAAMARFHLPVSAAHPADDATRRESASAEAMREAFAAWQMGLYPKGDDFERARVEWVPQIGGAPPEPFAVLCDGESVYLGDEWGAWQAAIRALPLPAPDDAVEEARAGEAFDLIGHIVNHARRSTNIDGTRRRLGDDEACGRNWIALVDKCEALLAARAALRREKGGA